MRRTRWFTTIGLLAIVAIATIGQGQDTTGYTSGVKASRIAASARLGIPQQIESVVDQLPPGCVQAWANNEPLGNVDFFRLEQQRFSVQPAAQSTPRHAPPPRLPGQLKLGIPHSLQPTTQSESESLSGNLPSNNNSPRQTEFPDSSLLPDPSPTANANSAGSRLANDDPLAGMGPMDDPLSGMRPSSRSNTPATTNSDSLPSTLSGSQAAKGYDPHAEAFAESLYPSALTCAKCHLQHYDEWRSSAHAYSAVSPMFHRFEQKLTELTQGTLGYFCVRCHAPVATQLDVPRSVSALDAPRIFREGITCVACHRVSEFSGKSNGERRIEPGDIHQPIVSTGNGEGVARAIEGRNALKLKLSSEESGPGQSIHNGVIRFETLSKSEFCASCHQVAVHPGVFLEVVYGQYRASPAAAKGQTCQDCHMGAIPGKPAGYACTQISELSGKPWGEQKKHAYHGFWGPGVSLAHPGIFPHNAKADRWSARQWLLFDWRAGWGDVEFERNLANQPQKPTFPAPWNEADERRDARKVLNDNLAKLAMKRDGTITTMEGSIAIEGPEIMSNPRVGLDLNVAYTVRNLSEGHNLPTGSLGAQPQLWLNVVLIGPDGNRIWETGDLDSYGDLRDLHSQQVQDRHIEPDQQLVNLQTKFLITNLKGTDREAILPVNFDVDQIPFLRPGTLPISVLNHPPFIRMEAHSIPALGERLATFRIPGNLLRRSGTYRLSIRMRSRMESPYFMRFCNATPEMIRSLNEQILDLRTQSHTFEVVGF